MEFLIALAPVVAKLLEAAFKLYEQSQSDKQKILQAYYEALADVPGLLEGLMERHAEADAEVKAAIAASRARKELAKQLIRTTPAPAPTSEE